MISCCFTSVAMYAIHLAASYSVSFNKKRGKKPATVEKVKATQLVPFFFLLTITRRIISLFVKSCMVSRDYFEVDGHRVYYPSPC